jgi:hypothetical protein
MRFVMALHLAGIISVGQGVAPPGADKLTTIVSWVAWGVFAVCLGGVLISGAKLAHAHDRGGGANQHIQSLVWTLVGCVIAGAATAIVGALS